MDKSLAALDLRGQAAQLAMVRARGLPEHRTPRATAPCSTWCARTGRWGGGFRSEARPLADLLDELQDAAKLPLLVSPTSSAAWPSGCRTAPLAARRHGARRLPPAAGEAAARFAGELTGREGRAAGIHWALAPVADVNNNPANPIINLRSFGEDPAAVSGLVAAFVAGARAGGILTAVKHFPGHGDTALDSHLELPTIGGDRERVEGRAGAPSARRSPPESTA